MKAFKKISRRDAMSAFIAGPLAFLAKDARAFSDGADDFRAVSQVPISQWQSVLSINELRDVLPGRGNSESYVLVEGHTTVNDDGGGLFKFEPTSYEDDDNGIVIKPNWDRENGRWLRVRENSGVINVAWFGLAGDGVQDDGIAIQAALDACPLNGVVVLPQPDSYYRTTNSLRMVRSQELIGVGIMPTIWLDGYEAPVITVEMPLGSIVILDNMRLIGGAKGIDLRGEGLTRHTRIRNLDIHGCSEVGIDINTGMIGARFENVQVRASPNYGIRCLNTSAIISVQFVSCRIVTTDVAAIYFAHNHQSSIHAISFFSPIIEGNRGAGIVLRGGYLLSLHDVHFERNGLFTGEPDLDMGSNEYLRALCEVHFERGSFSAPSDLQVENGTERIRFATHHVGLIMNGTKINTSTVINASNESAGVWMAFTNTQTVPTIINYPGTAVTWTRFGHMYLGAGLTTSGIASAATSNGTPFPFNLSGSFDIEDEELTATVKFVADEPSTQYKLAVTPSARSGSPTAGSNRIEWIDKHLDGFTVYLEQPPGEGNSVTFDWTLIR